MAQNTTRGSRRSFMGVVVGLGAAAISALALVPGLGVVLDPVLRRRKSSERWTPVARLDAVPEDLPAAFPILGDRRDAWERAPVQRLGTVWLRRSADDGVLALSAECPHLGCQVGFDTTRNRFGCPCHNAVFSLDGKVAGGPAPRAMDSLEARVRNGTVEVQFQRFRTQVPTKEPLG